jgi:uncharacterized membrane protein YqiK
VSIQDYWQQIRAKEKELAAEHGQQVWVTSILQAAGKVSYEGHTCCVDTENAARLLVKLSHRVATPEEIAAQHEREVRQAQANQDIESRRVGSFAFTLPAIGEPPNG